jgi:hypothetical protein
VVRFSDDTLLESDIREISGIFEWNLRHICER